MKKIAAIVLTYNSDDDLAECLSGLNMQANIELSIIVVDNASEPSSRKKMEHQFRATLENTAIVENLDQIKSSDRRIFIRNSRNSGYSAGNNIGIKVARHIGCDTVLIVNPDIRIDDPNYLNELSAQLHATSENVIAGSRIISAKNRQQSPLREPTFFEEFRWGKGVSFVQDVLEETPIYVEKICGACLLIRMSFLDEIGDFDETPFLYSEEPILAAQARKLGGKIVFVPALSVRHLHNPASAAVSSKNMLLFIKSRSYYLLQYARYKPFQRVALRLSYALLFSLHWLRIRLVSQR